MLLKFSDWVGQRIRRLMCEENLRTDSPLADPESGQWWTTTLEVARLIDAHRSTADRVLRTLEEKGFLYVQRVRHGTTQLVISFGRFFATDPSSSWPRQSRPRCGGLDQRAPDQP